MSNPLVTVWCSTYNHEKYIAQAIEGFVMQKTDFPVEIYVHDDASTDNTANIIREYAAKYPQVNAICLTKNMFSVDKSYLNRIMFEKAKGKYIAMCEGDDYWTDPLKLQKQVDFLEANPDFVICHHLVEFLDEAAGEMILVDFKPNEVTTFEDLALGNHINTLSCVYRNGLAKVMPEWFRNSIVGDYPLHLLNAQSGKIKLIDEVMAVYRIHPNGVFSSKTEEQVAVEWIPLLKTLKKNFSPRGERQFGEQIAVRSERLLFLLYDKKSYDNYVFWYSGIVKYFRYFKARTFIALTIRYFLCFVPAIIPIYHKLYASRHQRKD